jgi:hypothetical protein
MDEEEEEEEVKAVRRKDESFGTGDETVMGETPYEAVVRSAKWEHIRWKSTPPCKLWKLRSELHDVDLRKDSLEVGGMLCKTHERWKGCCAKLMRGGVGKWR